MFRVLTQDLLDDISKGSKGASDRFVFLEQHPKLKQHWEVNSFDPTFHEKLRGVIGSYRAIPPFALGRLADVCAEHGYELVFLTDPAETFDWLASLVRDPEVTITSDMPGTIKGFLPFQLEGYNYVKPLKGAWLLWSTGVGKTVAGAGLTKYHQEQGNFDLCVWVVKTHNKVNTQRALKALVDLDSIIIDGNVKQREAQYASVAAAMAAGQRPVMITNYEKFRDDPAYFQTLFSGFKISLLWDEMPTKLSNRTSKLYRSVCEALYTSFTTFNGKRIYYPSDQTRPSELRQIALSATPIQNNPEGYFSCIRLLDPDAAGTVADFKNNHIITRRFRTKRGRLIDIVDGYRNLDLLGARTAYMVHSVDKNSPEIAKQFPKVIAENIYVDLDPADAKLYQLLTAEYEKLLAGNGSSGISSLLSMDDLLAAIGALQMICDDPRLILASALAREGYERELAAYCKAHPNASEQEIEANVRKRGSDVALRLRRLVGNDAAFSAFDKKGELRCGKLLALKDILDTSDKVIVFSTFGQLGLPLIAEALADWGYGHVVYHGGMSMKEKQAAQDRFVSDPACKVFLSSDAGSDSLNLEAATTVVHYNLPWTWAMLTQRQNRAHRITSKADAVRYYTLTVANTVEDRKQEILDTKHRYHQQVLEGEIADNAEALRGRQELIYILTGNR